MTSGCTPRRGCFELYRVDEKRTSIANGEVTVGRVAGPASVDGSAIRIGLLTSGRVDLSNSSGAIEVGIAEGAISTPARATGTSPAAPPHSDRSRREERP